LHGSTGDGHEDVFERLAVTAELGDGKIGEDDIA
jgi:hypothetical protein